MITCKTKKWGNSMGILIPQEEVKKLKLHEGQTVSVEIVNAENPLKELFGSGKGRGDLRVTLEEIRTSKELESRYLQ